MFSLSYTKGFSLLHGNGWLDTDGPDHLYFEDFSLSHTYTEFGYEEMAKNKNEGRILSIKLGMAVAMSDGILDRSEGEKIKEWINFCFFIFYYRFVIHAIIFA